MIYAYVNRGSGRNQAGCRERGGFAGLGVEPADWVRSRLPCGGMIGKALILIGFGEIGLISFAGSAIRTAPGTSGERRRGPRTM